MRRLPVTARFSPSSLFASIRYAFLLSFSAFPRLCASPPYSPLLFSFVPHTPQTTHIPPPPHLFLVFSRIHSSISTASFLLPLFFFLLSLWYRPQNFNLHQSHIVIDAIKKTFHFIHFCFFCLGSFMGLTVLPRCSSSHDAQAAHRDGPSEDDVFCFSALTWNQELLCTLSHFGEALKAFPNRRDYDAFVGEFLDAFQRCAILVVQRFYGNGMDDVTLPCEEETQKLREWLQRNVPLFRTCVQKALRDGDVNRRSAQEIVPGVFLSGKYLATQPLALECFELDRIVQVYAGGDLQRTVKLASGCEPSACGAYLLEWAPIEWPSATSGCTSAACSRSSELAADGAVAFQRGSLFRAKLPYSGREIQKLVIPAVDDATYNLTQHFCEDVFKFIRGDPNRSDAPRRTRTLVHCSAGMHRSPAFVVAYLIWCAHGTSEETSDATVNASALTVEEWCLFVKSKRAVSMPTDFAKAQLAAFFHSYFR